jgi:hypothetical protein
VCNQGLVANDGYLFRDITIRVRHLDKPASTPKKGEPYNPELVSGLLETITASVRHDDNHGAQSIQYITTGKYPALRMRYATACTIVVPEAQCYQEVKNPKCADVRLDVYTIDFDPNNLLANLIALPRSPDVTNFAGTPKGLLLTNPRVSIGTDRAYGAVGSLDVRIPLLAAADIARGWTPSDDRDDLGLTFHGSRSLDERFYEVASRLEYRRVIGERLRWLRVAAAFSSVSTPAGTTVSIANAPQIVAGLQFKPFNGRPDSINLNIAGAWNWRRFGCNASVVCLHDRDDAVTTRMTFDSVVRGVTNRIDFRYRRDWTTAFAYSTVGGSWLLDKEFGDSHHTLAVSARLDGGAVLGAAPNYAFFFGGSNASTANAQDLMDEGTPTPVVRSFGRGGLAIGAAGARDFESVSLDVAFPLPGLSRPLIPEDEICKANADGDEVCEGIATVLKKQVEVGKSFLVRMYKDRGYPRQKAEEAAEHDLASARPIVAFVADRANLYSIRPVLMADFARLNIVGTPSSKALVALGGGAELTVVIAKLRIGYVQTVLNDLSPRRPGNFVFTLKFANMF